MGKLIRLVAVAALVSAAAWVPGWAEATGPGWNGHGHHHGGHGWQHHTQRHPHFTIITEPRHRVEFHDHYRPAYGWPTHQPVWVPGVWYWTGYQWVWVSGYWAR